MSLRINSDFNGVTDPDAGRYIAAVEAADGQLLEFAVGRAMNNFIVGCKADGTWDAIKASCILAGARTLAGALVPLVGTAPTNFNFVSGDYDRRKITGSTGKYLDSNTNTDDFPQNSFHMMSYTRSVGGAGSRLLGSGSGVGYDYLSRGGSANFYGSSRGAFISGSNQTGAQPSNGFYGTTRTEESQFVFMSSVANRTVIISSTPTPSEDLFVFGGTWQNSFYSIGTGMSSTDFSKYGIRINALMSAIDSVIL